MGTRQLQGLQFNGFEVYEAATRDSRQLQWVQSMYEASTRSVRFV